MTDEQDRKEPVTTSSGIEVPTVFDAETARESGFNQEEMTPPGTFPYTRGPRAEMYRGRLWTMRQYAGFSTAAESNERYRMLLDRGTTGLSVAFDLPTQIGMDSDGPLARGEVGKVGVAIDTIDDMETLLDQIPLEEVSLSMTINAPAAILLAMVLVVAERRGIDWSVLRGTIQNDILKEYTARGTYIFPPVPSLRLVTDTFEFCAREVPRWNTISISGYHIREAGATAVEEIAFTLANAIEYVQQAVNRGLDVDSFAPRLSFFFNAHNEFLEEVAKFRAARTLWAKIIRDRFGAKDPKSMALRFHAQTAGSTLTAQQPENNVVRVAYQALAAVLGGCQSLHTNSRDEALALPTEESVIIALRTQQILAHETGVAKTADPLGGSWAIEALTRELMSGAEDLLAQIDAKGGALAAIEDGWIQQKISESAYDAQKDIESSRLIVVGVNEFVSDESNPLPVLRIDDAIETEQVTRLRAFREARDGNRDSADSHRASLERLAEATAGGSNLLDAIVDAVRNLATVGEIVDTMKAKFGEYKEQGF